MKNKMRSLGLMTVLILGVSTTTAGCASTQESATIESVGDAGQEVAVQGGKIAVAAFDAVGAIFKIIKGFGKDVGKITDAVIPDSSAQTPPVVK